MTCLRRNRPRPCSSTPPPVNVICEESQEPRNLPRTSSAAISVRFPRPILSEGRTFPATELLDPFFPIMVDGNQPDPHCLPFRATAVSPSTVSEDELDRLCGVGRRAFRTELGDFMRTLSTPAWFDRSCRRARRKATGGPTG